jgi:hypothetical protein
VPSAKTSCLLDASGLVVEAPVDVAAVVEAEVVVADVVEAALVEEDLAAEFAAFLFALAAAMAGSVALITVV